MGWILDPEFSLLGFARGQVIFPRLGKSLKYGKAIEENEAKDDIDEETEPQSG